MLDRMYNWWAAVTQNGISNDQLPVIVLVLVIMWLGAFASSWAIFRWRQAWLGLLPGGIVLMWNISFLPNQFSYAFVVFLFGAVLLVMRMHVAKREQEWDGAGVVYPEFITLSTLNATFWVTLGLIVVVWLVPLADRSETAHQRWDDFTAPLTRHLAPLSRVFVSVNAKKPVNIHNIKDALPFQGKIELNGNDAVQVNVKLTPEMAQFLREQSFDEYTRDGWKVNVTGDLPLAAGDRTLASEVDPTLDADGNPIAAPRQDVTINLKVEGGNNDHLFSLGQPLSSDQASDIRVGGSLADVSSLKPSDHLSNGDEYTVTGSVAEPSIDQLKAAGDNYPQWVKDRYLSLPNGTPRRIRRKAEEVTNNATTPYDAAVAIESYLRTFPNDFNIPKPAAGRDPVDYFLFDAQRGYFDYHASAMAVMLRELGIPARVATGYVVDPLQRDGDSDTFRLTQRNAFAWPEVYFPGIGWVEFNPTPTQPVVNRPGAPNAASGNLNGERNINPEEPPIDLGISPDGPAPGATANAGSSGSAIPWGPIIAFGIAGFIALAIGGAGKFAWEYGLAGLPRPAQLWEKTVRLATIGKAGPQPHETPREFASRLRRDVQGADAAGYLASRYESDRFGHKELSDDEAEKLESAWMSLRGALLRRALRLKPRRRA
jgi:transglutaminase-like putative cysteine protease